MWCNRGAMPIRFDRGRWSFAEALLRIACGFESLGAKEGERPWDNVVREWMTGAAEVPRDTSKVPAQRVEAFLAMGRGLFADDGMGAMTEAEAHRLELHPVVWFWLSHAFKPAAIHPVAKQAFIALTECLGPDGAAVKVLQLLRGEAAAALSPERLSKRQFPLGRLLELRPTPKMISGSEWVVDWAAHEELAKPEDSVEPHPVGRVGRTFGAEASLAELVKQLATAEKGAVTRIPGGAKANAPHYRSTLYGREELLQRLLALDHKGLLRAYAQSTLRFALSRVVQARRGSPRKLR